MKDDRIRFGESPFRPWERFYIRLGMWLTILAAVAGWIKLIADIVDWIG